jgi:hypothetical protein
MKKLFAISILIVLSTLVVFGQEDDPGVEAPLGLRIIRNGQDYLIYADQNLSPNLNDYRKINYQVYFRKVDVPVEEINGKMYQLISIPGSTRHKSQDRGEKTVDGAVVYTRAGRSVDKADYDQNFWIEVDVIENYTVTEYYRYANDVFSGLLTAPFKYRLKTGSALESLIDGSLNIAPFVGWKWRVSSVKPHYIAAFGFAGLTSLNYNSANNTRISDADILENGTGHTYGVGVSFKFGDVSPGFVIGIDKGIGNLGNGFIYNDKVWISVSVNYDFFKPKQNFAGTKN